MNAPSCMPLQANAPGLAAGFGAMAALPQRQEICCLPSLHKNFGRRLTASPKCKAPVAADVCSSASHSLCIHRWLARCTSGKLTAA